MLASLIGTTGASMVMIRPLLRANDNRRYNVHVVVFFIFLVSNIGGSLTPLGDPPLFLGFLRGVDFFWTTTHLLPQTLFVAGLRARRCSSPLDAVLYRRETEFFAAAGPDAGLARCGVAGCVNFALIGVVIARDPDERRLEARASASRSAARVIELQNVVRDIIFIAAALASLRADAAGRPRGERLLLGTDPGGRQALRRHLPLHRAGDRHAARRPERRLRAARRAGHAPRRSPNNAAYFWLTGALSSFLDNAPTYLVFFELAGGDAAQLMTAGALTLAAISCGAVFMGANTYIGNAPNFMVYAIAKDAGVAMPSFFGYMLWSGVVLIPVFVLATFIFFQ